MVAETIFNPGGMNMPLQLAYPSKKKELHCSIFFIHFLKVNETAYLFINFPLSNSLVYLGNKMDQRFSEGASFPVLFCLVWKGYFTSQRDRKRLRVTSDKV